MEDFKKQKLKDSVNERKNINSPPEELLTKKEVAKIFRVCESTVYNWCKSGFIERYGIGNKIFFKSSEILNCLTKIDNHEKN